MEKEEKMRLQSIRQAGIKYKQISLWLAAALALAASSLPAGCRINAMISLLRWLNLW